MSTDAHEFLAKLLGKLTLGQAIKAIRLSENKTQIQFARLLKVTPSYLSDLERDCKEVSPRKAAEMAKILEQSEKQFIRLALQDSLHRYGFAYRIDVHDSAA